MRMKAKAPMCSTDTREDESLILWLHLKCATCTCFTPQSSPIKPTAQMTCLNCKNLHNRTPERGSDSACVDIAHRWDVMNTNLSNLQRGASAASPRRTRISKHKHPSPCQQRRCGCGWLSETRILLFFPEIMAEVNRACLGVCTPSRAKKKPAQFPGRRSRKATYQ